MQQQQPTPTPTTQDWDDFRAYHDRIKKRLVLVRSIQTPKAA